MDDDITVVGITKRPKLDSESSSCSSHSSTGTRQLTLTEMFTGRKNEKTKEGARLFDEDRQTSHAQHVVIDTTGGGCSSSSGVLDDDIVCICESPPLPDRSSETTPELPVPTKRQSWCCTPLCEISHGPSTYPILSPLSSSPLHCIAVRTDISQRAPPVPYPSSFRDVWDNQHVRMPCSIRCLYPIGSDNNLEQKWSLIVKALAQPIKTSHDLERAILSYNTRFASKWTFHSLHSYFNNHITPQQRDEFFNTLLPKIIQLAISLPSTVTHALPLLRKQQNYSLTLSQHQIACLLANAFFCTFPRRNSNAVTSEYARFPSINFNTLFTGRQHGRKMNKLECIIHYFRRVTTIIPTGTVTFSRQVCKSPPKWENCKEQFTRLHVTSEGTIEDNGDGMLQVDFANKYIGGGVLSQGCVQEEIRFLISPELLISRLFTEELDDNESLLITGAEQYSKYSGYADTFAWSDDHIDQTVRDSWGRRQVELVAIDALVFHRSKWNQYKPGMMCRELNKAYCGFASSGLHASIATPSSSIAAVATGNWGCGAFGGEPCLKAVLQWMAASVARRDVVYFTFYQQEIMDELERIHAIISRNNASVGKVWQTLVNYYNAIIKQRQKIELADYLENNL